MIDKKKKYKLGDFNYRLPKKLIAQPGLQVRTIRRQRRKNETAINFHPRHGFHMEIGIVQAEAGVVVTTLNWDMAHLAIQLELPGVITAGKDATRIA